MVAMDKEVLQPKRARDHQNHTPATELALHNPYTDRSEHKKMKRIIIVATAMGLIFALWTGVALAKNINGDNSNETLVGTKNADTINGKGGNDLIYGLKGSDNLNGDDGKDFIDSVDGSGKDKVDCGKGSDDVAADKGDNIDNNCETVKKYSL
jgi:Ca2+-binding RTX toxin-like protein